MKNVSLAGLWALFVALAPVVVQGAEPPVSYFTQIRPIFQANCNGCHQPAKAGGHYVMTLFQPLLKGGESEAKAIVPGKPAESNLVDLITPQAGRAEMPKDKPALSAESVALVRRWIAEGAQDDSAAHKRQGYGQDRLPQYTKAPAIPSLDYSPDGKLLAVAGFHEALLIDTATDKVAARLIGEADRIESVRFSPDGKLLAVVGGQPSRRGEVQIWDVATRKMLLAKPFTYNTLYGASWSPDGKLLAFGCGDLDDNSVRVMNVKTGEQVLYQAAHTDWVRDTCFSVDGSHVVSVDRDMTVKLTEVATQRFIDNVTSITPGALKGGVQAVARHPKLDQIVAGGSDGTPRVYRLFRESKRIIGDDANLIMELFPLTGRVFSVRFSADGKRIASASSLDGKGEIVVNSYDYAADVPQDLKNIMGKVPGSRNQGECDALEAYKTQGVKLLARIPVETPIYALAFEPSGKHLAATGTDGLVRIYEADTGKLVRKFPAVPLSPPKAPHTYASGKALERPGDVVSAEQLPKGVKVIGLEVQPKSIELSGPFDYAQLLITAKLDSGETADLTRLAKIALERSLVQVSPTGLVQPLADGEADMFVGFDGQAVIVPVKVAATKAPPKVDFVHDVAPTLSKLGCNQGTCHGAAKGKTGFKLSLRGYDPIYDVRALTDDLASRRVNLVSPDDSLMLLKASGEAPHSGGQLTRSGQSAYELLRTWILDGAKLDNTSPRVTKLEVAPLNPVIPRVGGRQQVRVLATYANGQVRDVTQEAFVDSGNTEVVTASRFGLMTAVRRGESPILVRFEGSYAATTITVMGDRTGFVWKQPETWGPIDDFVAKKWQRMKIQPSELSTDAEFIRRVYLDLTGLPPTADDVRLFLDDKRPTRVKRDALIDKLVGNPQYVEYWTNKWADLLQVNRKFLGPEGAVAFRGWIREQVDKNTPYDQFVHSILTVGGSNREHPAASYYKILRDPTNTMENTTHLFLAVRFNCNKCHDHPFERWTQDQYYQTAAYFAQVGLKTDPKSDGKTIGGTAVEGAKPLYEVVYDMPQGDVKHDRTGEVAPPKFPYPCKFVTNAKATRREQVASWLTSADNQYFARSYVNRLWGYLLGMGIMEPIDDIRAGNPPSNAELLDYLTREFIANKFDVRSMIKLIAKSRTYQLSYMSNKWNDDDKLNYSHATARRLPAEVLYDTVYAATGTPSKFPGVKPGIRAAELPDVGVELPSGFLSTFGRPVRESACECERSSGMQMGPVMALISGPTISEAVGDPTNAIAKLVGSEKDDEKLVGEIFLRLLNRPATSSEVQTALASMREIGADHEKLVKALAEREKYAAPIQAKQEKEREVAIAATKKELEAYEKELAPKTAELEKARQAKIAAARAELTKYEGLLPAKQEAWEKKQTDGGVEWIPLRASEATGPRPRIKLKTLADRSILVSGEVVKGALVVQVNTRLQGITAIRLEALSDERLPRGGPGLSSDGNFVLSQFDVTAVSLKDAKQIKKLVFSRAVADFTQENFSINQTIDGNPNGNQGWAVAGGTGSTHWAVFEIKEPVGYEGGTKLTFKLDHKFNRPEYVLGRFRLSVAVAKRPVPLSLPEDLQSLLAIPAKERDKPQTEALSKYFQTTDAELKQRRTALGEANQPLPIDPKLASLREKLELVSRPVPLDGLLEQLREDVKNSAAQQANRRLTGAQDLVWALINSPAFLFNH